MVSPINYILDVKNPIEEAMRGYAFGRQDIEQRQVMQEREQMMGLRESQEVRAQQEFEMRRAEAARQRAQAEAGQSALMRLMDLGPNATANDYSQAWLANPSIRQDLGALKTMMEAPKLKTTLDTSSRLYALARQGNADAVRDELSLQFEAAKNSGDQAMAATYGSALEQMNTNPEAALQSIAATSAFTIMGLQGPEYLSNVDKALGLDAGGEAVSPIGKLRADLDAGRITQEEFDAATAEKGPLVQTIIGDRESEFAKTAGKQQATLFGAITERGVAASRSLRELEDLEALLGQVETGAGASFKAFLGQYGIATEGLSEIQAAEAAINRLVPKQREPGSGEMSNADLALFMRSVASLVNQPGGNQIIIDTIQAIAEYDVAAGIISGQALDGEITPAEARQALRDLPNPLAGFKVPQAKPAAAGGEPAASGDAKAAFMADPRVQALPEAQREAAWNIYQEQVGK